MTTQSTDVTHSSGAATTEHEFRRRVIAAGEARCAVFRRTYDAAIEDVWQACTDPARLARWYQPVEGDLRVGGRFTQGAMGGGVITRCEAPRLFTAELGGDDGVVGPDEIELRLTPGRGTTILEIEHATTLDSHEIGGQIFDAVYCMGGGYGPRLVTLDRYLRGELPADVDPTRLHERADAGPAIQASMAALDVLIQQDRARQTSLPD